MINHDANREVRENIQKWRAEGVEFSSKITRWTALVGGT